MFENNTLSWVTKFPVITNKVIAKILNSFRNIGINEVNCVQDNETNQCFFKFCLPSKFNHNLIKQICFSLDDCDDYAIFFNLKHDYIYRNSTFLGLSYTAEVYGERSTFVVNFAESNVVSLDELNCLDESKTLKIHLDLSEELQMFHQLDRSDWAMV
jgi:hypothetical protein